MKRVSLLMTLVCLASLVFAQMPNPIRWSHTSSVEDETLTVTLTSKINTGWHLYGLELPADGPTPTIITFSNFNGVELEGTVTTNSELISKFEPMFGEELNWYENEAVFTQKFKITDKNYFFEGEVTFMGCDDESCFMGDPYRFKIGEKASEITTTETAATIATEEFNGEEVVEENKAIISDIYTPVIAELKAFGETTNTSDSSYWTIFILGFLGGIVALFTPCVWPIIPMTVSFFLKGSKNKAKGRRDAVIYGLSIIVIYVTLGLAVTGIFGATALNALSTSAVFNILFFALLVIFAISFFGAFEIKLPASWTSKMDEKADATTGFLSIMLMAFTLVLVSFSCTGPIIGTLLVEAASGSSIMGPAIGMLGFAIALAIPFSFFALFPSMLQSMPKSGGWLNSVKVVLGFLELALSLKFLSVADLAYGWGILDREVFLALWIVIFALLGLYLIGKLTLPHDDKVEKVSVMRLMLALISFAYAIYLVPGLWGAPVRSASAFAPPLFTQDFNLFNGEVHASTTDYEIGVQMAQSANKPLLVDFSGFGCVNCRKMEAAVWTDPTVADMLHNKFILVTLMVDDRTPLAKPIIVMDNGEERELRTVGEKNGYLQKTKFGSSTQPFYVILDADTKPLYKSYSFNESVPNFIEFLNIGIENFKNK